MANCSCPFQCQHDVAEFKAASKRVRKQLDTPEKIRKFLMQNPAMRKSL